MKISYNVVKNYIPDVKPVEELAGDLVMHTAEVEEIIYEGENLKDVFIGEVLRCERHPDSDKLNCTVVNVSGKEIPIVCGASNVKAGIKVPVAIVGAELTPEFKIAKTKIRGEVSEGMICSEDELGMTDVRQEGILELGIDAPLGVSMREYLEKNDAILEIDNKAINHRPDLFSHIGIMREICAINHTPFDFQFAERDFSNLPNLGIKNNITDVVRRYIGLQIDNVKNIESPKYIKQLLDSADTTSKGLLIDISNYSLYLYGQPTHCFDADKITGSITIRYAKDGESFTALNDEIYELKSCDIVIADDVSVLALGGVIGGKDSAVSDSTTSIIVEGAHFEQSIIRQTGKRLGVRTDSLNVFEKDIVLGMPKKGVSLIASELEKNLDNITLIAYSDIYPIQQEEVIIDFDLTFINKIIGSKYTETEALAILSHLGITHNSGKLTIPFWRKDLNYKADIAEEIARIHGYDNIETTVPRINLGAVVQSDTYKLKNDTRDFFTKRGFFDMYTYSFVNKYLMEKMGTNTEGLVEMKNALSEELSHMKGSHLPNLMLSLEKNKRDFNDLKLFEIEKIYAVHGSNIKENYSLAGVMVSHKSLCFYDMQTIIADYFRTLGVSKYHFDTLVTALPYSHPGRTASIIIRGKEVGVIGEIHPKIANNFEMTERVGFFEIDTSKVESALYSTIKAHDLSEFQENNFDLNFVVDKATKGKDIHMTIEKTDQNLINKVELIDVYENEEKLPGKRSLTFKIFIQSMKKTLDDKIKNELIQEIIKKVEKKGGLLR